MGGCVGVVWVLWAQIPPGGHPNTVPLEWTNWRRAPQRTQGVLYIYIYIYIYSVVAAPLVCMDSHGDLARSFDRVFPIDFLLISYVFLLLSYDFILISL